MTPLHAPSWGLRHAAMRAGSLPSEPTPGMPCRTYHGQWTDFYCTEADRTRA